jgi:c-di-GMP-binding flagellar brake protein YcgR
MALLFMLNAIKRILSGNEEILSIEPADQPPVSDAENPKFIVAPRKILRLLSEVEHNIPLCTVAVDDQGQFTSSIIGIDSDTGIIRLDELLPHSGNHLVGPQSVLKVSLIHKGIHLSFNLSHLQIDHERGIRFYSAPLPQRVYYPQRRNTPRVGASDQHLVFNAFHEKSQQTLTGTVFDLSRAGIGVEIPKSRVRLYPGDTLGHCRILLDNYPMDFNLQVRFVKNFPGNSSGKMQIGGAFVQLDNRSEHKLSHFIAGMERYELRKQKAP